MEPPDPAAQKDPVNRLERQVERGAFFTHAAMDRLAVRVRDAESFVMGLAELLAARGVLAAEEIQAVMPEDPDEPSPPTQAEAAAAISAEIAASAGSGSGAEVGAETAAEAGAEPADGVSVASDGGAAESLPVPHPWPSVAVGTVQEGDAYVPVNCAERMHICHAVCCKLNFALTAPEIDGGKVKWDLGFPFMIRHEEDGYCTHLDRASGGCGIYADRPGVCHHYSCAGDPRIWTDFDKMVLNEEFLAEHVSGEHRIRARANLPMMDRARQRPPGRSEAEQAGGASFSGNRPGPEGTPEGP